MTANHHHPVTVLFGIVLMCVGLLLDFLGIRLFRLVIGLTGFILGALAAYVALLNIHLHYQSFGSRLDAVLLVGSAVSGLVGVGLSWCMWYWTLLGLGALGGLCLGILALGMLLPDPPVTLFWMRPVVLVFCGIVGAVLVRRFERPLIVFSTAVIGSLLLCFGLDVFLDTGFDVLLLKLLANEDTVDAVIRQERVLGMTLVCAGMAILGMVVQFWLVGRRAKDRRRK